MVVINGEGQEKARYEMGSSPMAPAVLTPDARLYVSTRGRLRALPASAALATGAPWPMFRQNPRGTASIQTLLREPLQPVLLPPKPFANKVRIASEPALPPASLELYRSATTNFADAIRVATGRAGEFL